jgi:hypothetical protein
LQVRGCVSCRRQSLWSSSEISLILRFSSSYAPLLPCETDLRMSLLIWF